MSTDSTSAAIWLHLLETRKALNAADLVPVAQGSTRDQVDKLLSMMSARGAVRVGQSPTRKNGRIYTVDIACVLPRGLTLDQVLSAAGVVSTVPEAPELEDNESQERPPRGEFGHIGKVASVFAMGAGQ